MQLQIFHASSNDRFERFAIPTLGLGWQSGPLAAVLVRRPGPSKLRQSRARKQAGGPSGTWAAPDRPDLSPHGDPFLTETDYPPFNFTRP
jgi:hypothetical protein